MSSSPSHWRGFSIYQTSRYEREKPWARVRQTDVGERGGNQMPGDGFLHRAKQASAYMGQWRSLEADTLEILLEDPLAWENNSTDVRSWERRSHDY